MSEHSAIGDPDIPIYLPLQAPKRRLLCLTANDVFFHVGGQSVPIQPSFGQHNSLSWPKRPFKVRFGHQR